MARQSQFESAALSAHPILRAVTVMSTLAGWLAAAMILSAVFITCQMIFIRFVLNGSTIWQSEAVIYLIVGATMLGLSYVEQQHGHVNVDLLPSLLSAKPRLILQIVTMLVSMLVSMLVIAVLLYFGIKFWYYAWSRGWRSDSVWGVKLWIPYLPVPVGFALLLAQMMSDFAEVILFGHRLSHTTREAL